MDTKEVLKTLADIADAYDESKLDEWRPEWGDKIAQKVQLLAGRGGKELLTLADCITAREILRSME